MLTRRRQVIRILKSVIRTLGTSWALTYCTIAGECSFSVVCAEKTIDVDIEDVIRWLDPTAQHVQFWTRGYHLFLSFATIVCKQKTFENIKRALIYAINFVRCPTAYQMSKIAFDSIAVGCAYDKVHFTQPHLKKDGIAIFTLSRTHPKHELHMKVSMWICATCGPHCALDFTVPQDTDFFFSNSSAATVVDTCINEVAGRAFLFPEHR